MGAELAPFPGARPPRFGLRKTNDINMRLGNAKDGINPTRPLAIRRGKA